MASPVWLSLVLFRHTTPSPAQKLKEKTILHESITVCVNDLLLVLSFLSISIPEV